MLTDSPSHKTMSLPVIVPTLTAAQASTKQSPVEKPMLQETRVPISPSPLSAIVTVQSPFGVSPSKSLRLPSGIQLPVSPPL